MRKYTKDENIEILMKAYFEDYNVVLCKRIRKHPTFETVEYVVWNDYPRGVESGMYTTNLQNAKDEFLERCVFLK